MPPSLSWLKVEQNQHCEKWNTTNIHTFIEHSNKKVAENRLPKGAILILSHFFILQNQKYEYTKKSPKVENANCLNALKAVMQSCLDRWYCELNLFICVHSWW